MEITTTQNINRIITAKFKGGSKSLFACLKQTKALVLLSIKGNELCAGEYLNAMIETAKKTHLFTTFLVADEVHWNNLRDTFSHNTNNEESILKQNAIKVGDEYLNNNLIHFINHVDIDITWFNENYSEKSIDKKLQYINQFSKQHFNFEILRWKDWALLNQDFVTFKRDIESKFHSEKTLKESIECCASIFASRHSSSEKSKELIFNRSVNYLIEETSSIIWNAAKLNYNFIVYPGELIKPFEVARDYFINNSPSQNPLLIFSKNKNLLLNWLEAKFHGRHKNNKLENAKHNNSTSTLISQIFYGITSAILAENLEINNKTDLLVNIIYKYENNNQILEKSKTLEHTKFKKNNELS